MKKVLVLIILIMFLRNDILLSTTANYQGPTRPCLPPCCIEIKKGIYKYFCLPATIRCVFKCSLECRPKFNNPGEPSNPLKTYRECGLQVYSEDICLYIGPNYETDVASFCSEAGNFSTCKEEAGFSGCYITCYHILISISEIEECVPCHIAYPPFIFYKGPRILNPLRKG